MESLNKLIDVSRKLMGPEGCPWDRKQTFESLKPYLLEEAHEALEAIDLDSTELMVEELGDLFFTILFYALLGEKEERFTFKEIIDNLTNKLIRRHPHVFGAEKADSIEEVWEHWNKAKSKEKAHRKSPFEGIPKTLSPLMRGQKVFHKIRKKETLSLSSEKISEEELGEAIMELIHRAECSGIDAESIARMHLNKYEKDFGG